MIKRPARSAAAAAVTAVLAVMLALCAGVYKYGDDFFYSVFTTGDLSYFLTRHAQHYLLANGRVVVHLLATALLGVDMWVWRVLNALCLTACVALAAGSEFLKEKKLFGLWAAAGVLLLTGPAVARQSLLWLTGACNYVYPALMLLIYWRLMESGSSAVRRALPVTALLASATNEQGGLMCFGLTLLFIAERLIFSRRDGKKPAAVHYISLALTLCGFLTVVLAPGLRRRGQGRHRRYLSGAFPSQPGGGDHPRRQYISRPGDCPGPCRLLRHYTCGGERQIIGEGCFYAY